MCRGQVPNSGPGKMGGIKTKALQLGLLGSNSTPSVSGYGAGGLSFPICEGEQTIGLAS